MFILKQLRRKKRASQTDLAKAINVSLRTIQLYEKKGANIPIKNLTKMAQYFDVSIAELYSHEGVNEEGGNYDNREILFKKGHSISKLDPGKYLVTVPLVMAKQHKKYRVEYDRHLFIESLPRIGFVIDQVSVGHYMAFEIANSSMEDRTVESIPNKAIVLAKLISMTKLAKALDNTPDVPWIIIHRNAVMCKKVAAYDKKEGTIICHSLNGSPEYSDFEIKVDDVEQLFMIIKKQVS